MGHACQNFQGKVLAANVIFYDFKTTVLAKVKILLDNCEIGIIKATHQRPSDSIKKIYTINKEINFIL